MYININPDIQGCLTTNSFFYNKIINHVNVDKLEHGGILLGILDRTKKLGRVTDVIPIDNVSATPQYKYESQPNQLIDALKTTTYFDKDNPAKPDFLGIFHSHPFDNVLPSRTDFESLYYSGFYIIISTLLSQIKVYYYSPDTNKYHLELAILQIT